MNTTTGGLRCHNPEACCAGQKPCPSPGACGVDADALELADALENVARNVVSDRGTIQRAAAALRRQHAALGAAAPAGLVLVPENPTRAMQDAWDRAPQNEDLDVEWRGAYAAMLAAAPHAAAASGAPSDPLQEFESPSAKALMRAWEEGWEACRDAEYVGEEAQNDAFNRSETVNRCIAEDQLLPTPNVSGASVAAAPQEPMFWVRLCSDGGWEGPLHNDRIEEVRKRSGAWSPLYLGAAQQRPAALVPLTAERIEAIWVEHGLDDCDPEGFARRIEADHGITGAPDGKT